MIPVDLDSWRVRATLCELLAFSFRYPTKALAQALCRGEWVDAAEEIASAANLTLPENKIRQSVPDVHTPRLDETFHDLRVEATRLFVGAPTPAVSPYEGVWRAKQDDVQALLFVSPYTMEVERFMHACGLGQPSGTNEPLDHVATELELLQYLSLVISDAILPEIPESEFPEGSAAAAYDAFVRDHVMKWMPSFAEATIRETRIPFYRAAGLMLQAFLNEH